MRSQGFCSANFPEIFKNTYLANVIFNCRMMSLYHTSRFETASLERIARCSNIAIVELLDGWK
ncbi:MAG: hypothetical protein COB90_04225 [Hyphomicrobiales bacterium]|nr:MAG: hypothetical protein COB90_04225 [Hyphomicrobiales bacterium]